MLSRTKKCQQGIQIVLQLCAEPNISFVILVIDVMQVTHQKITILKTTTLDVAMMATVFMEMMQQVFLQLVVVVLLLVPGHQRVKQQPSLLLFVELRVVEVMVTLAIHLLTVHVHYDDSTFRVVFNINPVAPSESK
jgi:hypothetical protein